MTALRKRTDLGVVVLVDEYDETIRDAVEEPVFPGRERRSRSEVYSAALREYVARPAPDETTEAMNQACNRVGTGRDMFVAAAARRILQRVEW